MTETPRPMSVAAPTRDERLRKAGLASLVLLGHAALFAGLILVQPRYIPPIPPPPMLVELIRPDPPPPPGPPRPVSREAGGGAPATPSRVHPTEPPPRPVEPVLTPPPEPAPEPVATVGAATVDTPGQGRGLGGQGTGTGAGNGPGAGPGAGAGRATLISGPSRDQIRRAQPRTGLAVRRVGRAEIRCRIRLSGQLEGCSVTREMPPGSRLGQAAVSLAPYYRWRPPTDSEGRPQDNTEITIGVDFPP